MEKRIVILGGGTAGWMSANLLAHHLNPAGFKITLIESPDVETIGVGEGSTPHIKQFFDTLGITEQQWMPKCNATFKNGIRFNNWSNKAGYESYFHPFPSMPDRQTAAGFLINCRLKQQGHQVDAHPDQFFLSSALASQHLSPVTRPNFPMSIGYGYHFDAGLLSVFLREHAKTLGVQHIPAHVSGVTTHLNGDIAHLQLDNHEAPLAGDWFVDCSGFAGLLIQKQLKIPFHSYQDALFNDKAVALASPVSGVIETQTQSTAMSHGWRWRIPLTKRVGNGYVYSSAYQSADQAETELREKLGLLDSDANARHLSMKVGRLERHWSRNCIAVGLSQGFIEPLEATALHLVQDTLESFISAFKSGDYTAKHREQFNMRISQRFDGIKDYIHCHYKVNSVTLTDYWQDNRQNSNLSTSLDAVLRCWEQGGDLNHQIEALKIGQFYSSISWHCLLAGYGHFVSRAPSNRASHNVNIEEIQQFITQCTSGFVPSANIYA